MYYCTCTLEPFYCGLHWYPSNCPDFRGVPISGVVLHRIATIGTKASAHILRGVLYFKGVCIEWFHYVYNVCSLPVF